MKRFLLFLMLIGAVLLCAASLAEPAISFSPGKPRMGDYVDVTVTPDRESPVSITWSLSTPEKTVFSGKEQPWTILQKVSE